MVIFIIGERFFSSCEKCHHQEAGFPDWQIEAYMGSKIPTKSCKKIRQIKKQSKMSLIDVIRRRKNIVCQESEGMNLAIYLINEFKDRTFTFKGLKNKYLGLSGENLLKRIQDELDSTLILYRYTTKAKKYTDRKGVPQVEIKLAGKASTMSRYNPLDIELEFKTEMPLIYPELEK